MLDFEYIAQSHLSGAGWHVPICYEDSDIVVINKPSGLIVHGGNGIKNVTLSDFLRRAFENNNQSESQDRFMGIVHRLDQFTEGVMVIAKTIKSRNLLVDQFKNRQVTKKYFAILKGRLLQSGGIIDRPIGRDLSARARKSCHHYVPGTEKPATTKYEVIHRLGAITAVDVHLITGRTHQIRVHFASMDAPVFGDSLYSKQKQRTEGYYLQSYQLSFNQPITNHNVSITIPVSCRLKKYIGNDGQQTTNNNQS